MSDVVHQRQRLGKVFVQPQRASCSPGNLCNLDRMGQAATKMVGRPAGKYLCLACQPAKSARLNDAFSITLKPRAARPLGRGKHTYRQVIVRIPNDGTALEIGRHDYLECIGLPRQLLKHNRRAALYEQRAESL
jgi:hypothetical protein